MDTESDSDSIQATERGNEEHEIKLNRARNSHLNVFIPFPPEILGIIFYWTVIFQRRSRSPQIPRNLRFVCRHWFEVALQTPQLWTSWGDSLEDLERCCTFPTVSEPNLKLERGQYYYHTSPSKPLLDTLQDRAAQDFI